MEDNHNNSNAANNSSGAGKYGDCVRDGRLDNAIRRKFGDTAADLTTAGTVLAVGNMVANLAASASVPYLFRGGFHWTSWQHVAGSLLDSALGTGPTLGRLGKLAGGSRTRPQARWSSSRAAMMRRSFATCAVE